MTLNSENNPCCRKKGTLVITIEPCTKGKDTEQDRYLFTDRYIPGLPKKTPRTMEIEVKIKAKDQELSSEEEPSPVASAEETLEETELTTHYPSAEDEKYEKGEEEAASEETGSGKKDSSGESVKSAELKTKTKISCSSKTIPLERKPCSETCPGPFICFTKKEHFMGDRCKLHDPTIIGQQILAMHKNGLIQKRLYMNDRIYPEHILSTISEISRRQTGKIVAANKHDILSGNKGDVFEELTARKTISYIMEARDTKEVEEPLMSKMITSLTKPLKEEGGKKNRSGCFC